MQNGLRVVLLDVDIISHRKGGVGTLPFGVRAGEDLESAGHHAVGHIVHRRRCRPGGSLSGLRALQGLRRASQSVLCVSP